MSPPNGGGEYPDFDDADVTIMSQTGKIWKLHHQTLSNSSEMFKELFARSPSAKKSGVRWRLHMIDHPLTGDVDANGMYYKDFRPVSLNTKSSGFMPILWNGMGEEPKFNVIYDNLFRCMYNLKPAFGRTQDGDDSMKEALNLLTATSYAKAYPAVRLVIENHLLQFNQLLWYQVEKNPETWASTACKLQSAVILREAMIHLAGRYHLRGQESINKKTLEHVEWGKAIYELATQKGRELKDYKLQVERRLFEFVPLRMLHPPVQLANGVVTAGRQVYAGDIYWWMCLQLIRQYFSIALLQNRHHRADDGGIAFYRTLAAPHSYLLKGSLDAFHQQFCMTPKSRVVFAHGLNELKKDFVSVVEGLLVDHCQAQRGLDATPRGYVTCTVILDEEMPWVEKPELPQGPRRIRITDEDEDDNQEDIEVDDGRAAPLLSSSPSNMFVGECARVPPASPLSGNDAPGRLSSRGTQNGSSKPATSRRRRNSEVGSDHDGTPPLPTKKAKTNPTMPRFPTDGRLTSDRASILSNGIRAGLIVGDELANINVRAEISAAAGIPNMGGLISNPIMKPRGGFNQMFTNAIAGGCGASSRASPAGGFKAAKNDNEVDEEEEDEDEEEVADDAIEEGLKSKLSDVAASHPASGAPVNKSASLNQASIESTPDPSLLSKKNGSAAVAPASEVTSQQTTGVSTQNTHTSTAYTQISVTTSPDVDSNPITQGGRPVASQATSCAKAAGTHAQSTPTPLLRPQQGDRSAIAPVSPTSSAVQISVTAANAARDPTLVLSSRTHRGTTSQESLQELAREGMKSMVDRNARLREAIPAQSQRIQEGNPDPTTIHNHVQLSSQPDRLESHGATTIGRLPAKSSLHSPLPQPDNRQHGPLPPQLRYLPEIGANHPSRPIQQNDKLIPPGQRGQSSIGGSVNSDPRSMTSTYAPRPRSSGLEPASQASSGPYMGSFQPAPSGTFQFGNGTFASNPALGAPSDGPMAFSNSGPSQQPPRPRGLEQNFSNPQMASSQGFVRSATPFEGSRSVQRAENSAFQGSTQPNPLVPTFSQPAPVHRSGNFPRDLVQAPRRPSSSQPARSVNHGESSARPTPLVSLAPLTDKTLAGGDTKAKSDAK